MTLFFYFSFESSKLRFQDLDLYAKKVYIPLKDLNLRGKTLVFSNEIIAALRTKNLF